MGLGQKARALASKLEIEADEPGLTTAQLMLTNYDLKPVEPARRQWGPWNFVVSRSFREACLNLFLGRVESQKLLWPQRGGKTSSKAVKKSGLQLARD